MQGRRGHARRGLGERRAAPPVRGAGGSGQNNVKFRWKMPLEIHCKIPVEVQWKSEIPLENATESPLEDPSGSPVEKGQSFG